MSIDPPYETEHELANRIVELERELEQERSMRWAAEGAVATFSDFVEDVASESTDPVFKGAARKLLSDF